MTSATLSPAIPFAAAEPGAEAGVSDGALMARVRAGDADAFEPLVRRYEKRLFGYFVNLVEDPATAADLAQETFLRVYRAASRYRESGRFEAWLFRIAANLVRSRQRRREFRALHLPIEEVPATASGQLAGELPGQLAGPAPEALPEEAALEGGNPGGPQTGAAPGPARFPGSGAAPRPRGLVLSGDRGDDGGGRRNGEVPRPPWPAAPPGVAGAVVSIRERARERI